MPNTPAIEIDEARLYVAHLESHLQAHNLVYYHGSEVVDARTDTDEPGIVTKHETVKVTAQNLSQIKQGIDVYAQVIRAGQRIAPSH